MDLLVELKVLATAASVSAVAATLISAWARVALKGAQAISAAKLSIVFLPRSRLVPPAAIPERLSSSLLPPSFATGRFAALLSEPRGFIPWGASPATSARGGV